MITESTVGQISRRLKKISDINYCLGNMGSLTSDELALNFGAIRKTFFLPGAVIAKLLEEAKAHEESRLKELNALAAEEARS